MDTEDIRQPASLSAFTKLSRATLAVNQRLSGTAPLPKELQGSGFPILEVLLHKGPQSQCEISRKILRTTGNISQALDKLEAGGLILRLPGPDRRSHTIDLTEKGRTLIAQWFPAMARSITQAFSVLSPRELEELGRICKKLGLSLREP